MARSITLDQRHEVMARARLSATETNILRRYSIDLRLVDKVDNEDTQCPYCGTLGNVVTCNTYLVTMDRDYLCVDHCRDCWAGIIDNHYDTDPEYNVVTEMRQASNGSR